MDLLDQEYADMIATLPTPLTWTKGVTDEGGVIWRCNIHAVPVWVVPHDEGFMGWIGALFPVEVARPQEGRTYPTLERAKTKALELAKIILAKSLEQIATFQRADDIAYFQKNLYESLGIPKHLIAAKSPEQVRQAESPEPLTIKFVVHGEEVPVTAQREESLRSAVDRALALSGNRGRPSSGWELRDVYGEPLDHTKRIAEFDFGETVLLYVSLVVGFGGEVPKIQKPLPKRLAPAPNCLDCGGFMLGVDGCAPPTPGDRECAC